MASNTWRKRTNGSTVARGYGREHKQMANAPNSLCLLAEPSVGDAAY